MIWGNEQVNSGTMNAMAPSGNGNANCFWEEPAKVVAPTPKPNVQQNGTSKPLVKSQTVSNMQSVASNAKFYQNTPKPTPISKTNSSGNVTATANLTSTNNNKKPKSSNTNAKKGTNSGIQCGWLMDFHIESMCLCDFSDGDDEFGGWCAKALSAHNDVIDGEFILHTDRHAKQLPNQIK